MNDNGRDLHAAGEAQQKMPLPPSVYDWRALQDGSPLQLPPTPGA